MLTLSQAIFRDSSLRSRQLLAVQQHLRLVYASRYSVWLLLLLGVIRAVLFVMAYAPAHGADSADYFLYAAQFEGLDAPIVFDLIYPLYPLLIYIAHYLLGSIYLLVGFQIALSVFQGVLFYVGIRPYSPALGFGMALLVIGDAQTGILYNFISTEPLYMFLLNLAFCLGLIQLRRPSEKRIQTGDVMLGVVLALTLLARPVGRYLIVPFGVLFLLGTRAWWRTGVLMASYGVALIFAMLFNQVVFDQLEINGSGGFMLARPLVKSGLLDADNGPASAQVVTLREACPEGEHKHRCLIQQLGDWSSVQRLYSDAYQEMLQEHGTEFAELVVEAFTDFLKLPGLQYRGPQTPSVVQCADIDAKVKRDTHAYLEEDWILYGATGTTSETLEPIVRDIATAMCPPRSDNETTRRIVDRIAVRYKSLSRPYPYLWYGALGLLVLIGPWARRYLLPVLLAGAILANHAAISAVVLNVQPRYTAVVNPYKGFLALALLYVVGVFVVRLVDEWLARREAG